MDYKDFSYANVPDAVISSAAQEIEKAGCALELIWYKSNNPQDFYLFNVIASRNAKSSDENSFIKWMYNSSHGGLNNGHYNLTEEKAFALLQEHTDRSTGKARVSYSPPQDIIR